MALYGFFDAAERAMFRRLISVSRVGPKLALSVLSALSVSDVNNAVLLENAAAFDRVPGMGRKTAARVLLALACLVGAIWAVLGPGAAAADRPSTGGAALAAPGLLQRGKREGKRGPPQGQRDAQRVRAPVRQRKAQRSRGCAHAEVEKKHGRLVAGPAKLLRGRPLQQPQHGPGVTGWRSRGLITHPSYIPICCSPCSTQAYQVAVL